MVMLTAPLTALLALLSAASSLALPTNPAQAHIATQPLLEATLLADPQTLITDRQRSKDNSVDPWTGRLRGRLSYPRSPKKDASKSKSSNGNDNSTLIPPSSVLGGTVSKVKGNHTKEKSADASENEGKSENKKSGKKHNEDDEHAKRLAPEPHLNSSSRPLLDVSINVPRSMTRRRRHWHWYSPDVVIVDGPPHDITIEGDDSHIHVLRRHHREHVHVVSDHHGEIEDVDIDRKRRGVGNFEPQSTPWKRDTGSPGMIDIYSSSTKVASLVLQETNDTSGNTLFVMNASNGNNTGTLLKMVPLSDNSTFSTNTGDANTTTVNFQMLPPNPQSGVLCMTFDPNPSSALPMTAEPCDNNVTLHKSQEFMHNANTGAIAPMWNTSVPSSASKRQEPSESPSGAQNVTLIFTPAVESAQPSNKELVATFLPGNATDSSSESDTGDSQDTSDGDADSPDGMSSSDTAASSTSTDPSLSSTSGSPDVGPTDTSDPNSIYQEDVMTSDTVGPTMTSASFLTTATETTDVTPTQTPAATVTSTGQSSADVADSTSTPSSGAQQSFEWMFNAGM